jgi:arylsulfatase A-like enzyme
MSGRRRAAIFLLGASGALLGCHREPFRGPLSLLQAPAAAGARPRVSTLSMAGETRAALLESASFPVRLPRRPLLTFGMGFSYAGAEEAPGWYRLTVKAGDRVLTERTLNPRAARAWRDVSLPLEDLGGEATLEFHVRLTDREAREIPVPEGLSLGIAEPVVHDLDDYGKAKGIVVVSIDTLRRDHVGAYGYGKPTTPRLDRLAGLGILFEDAVSTSSWTLPAHLSMLTSVDPAVHGGIDMHSGFNRRPPTLPGLLRDAGYATRAITSHIYLSEVYGVHEGFQHLDFRQERPATEVAQRGIELVDRYGDRPFFLFLHLYDPHWHYAPPEQTRKLFVGPYTGGVTGNLADFSKRTRENTTPADLAHLLALYDGEVRYADDEVGRFLDHLQARGLAGSTLVVVTSDHGEEFLEHGSWEHQKTLYEEVLRIPLVVAGPGVVPRREPAQVSLLDVAPTVLAWAGLAAPAGFQGRSLLSPPGDREAYGETDHSPDRTRKLFLRAGQSRWKAVLSLDGASTPAAPPKVVREEWYDLAADPGETRSVPPAPAAADAIRSRALDRWRAGRRTDAPARPVCLSPEQTERLRALGYIGGLADATCTPAGAPAPPARR